MLQNANCGAEVVSEFDYQSVRHCSKTYGAKSPLPGDGKIDRINISILEKVLINNTLYLILITIAVLYILQQQNMVFCIKNVLIKQFELVFCQKVLRFTKTNIFWHPESRARDKNVIKLSMSL